VLGYSVKTRRGAADVSEKRLREPEGAKGRPVQKEREGEDEIYPGGKNSVPGKVRKNSGGEARMGSRKNDLGVLEAVVWDPKATGIRSENKTQAGHVKRKNGKRGIARRFNKKDNVR